MSEFKVGDVVQLRSGGPKMTINDEGSSGHWICVWFEGASNKTAAFKAEALKKIDA